MFHDDSRAGTLTSSAKSAQSQRTREQVVSQSHHVLQEERKQQAMGDSSLSALPTHFLWTISFSWSLVWFLLFPFRSFFSRPLSFPSAGVSPTPCQPHSLSALHSCTLLHLGSPVGGCACLGWGGKGLPSLWEPVVAFRRSKSPATLRPLLLQPTQSSGLSPRVRERKTPASGCEEHEMMQSLGPLGWSR